MRSATFQEISRKRTFSRVSGDFPLFFVLSNFVTFIVTMTCWKPSLEGNFWNKKNLSDSVGTTIEVEWSIYNRCMGQMKLS